jgi:hypothetical protein
VNPSTFTVDADSTVGLDFEANYDDGSLFDISSDATWETSDSTVATVQGGDVTAVVTGVGTGTVTIAAIDEVDPQYAPDVCYEAGWPDPCPVYTGGSGTAGGTVLGPSRLSLSLGSEITYNGTDAYECDGTLIGVRWGYSRCLTYTLLDQNGTSITVGDYTASENVVTISSNPPGVQGYNISVDVTSGTFGDFLAFLAKSPPAPQPGEYITSKQTITITDNKSGKTYPSIRTNCLHFQYNDVSVTDITGGGACN